MTPYHPTILTTLPAYYPTIIQHCHPCHPATVIRRAGSTDGTNDLTKLIRKSTREEKNPATVVGLKADLGGTEF